MGMRGASCASSSPGIRPRAWRSPTANDRAGTRARFGGTEMTFVAAEDAPLGDAQLVFSALPHGASAQWVRAAHAAGAKVVDLSADLRPGNGARSRER